jgi:hypothetical protein
MESLALIAADGFYNEPQSVTHPNPNRHTPAITAARALEEIVAIHEEIEHEETE